MKTAVFITNIPAHYRVALIRRTSMLLLDSDIRLITLFSRLTYNRRSYWNINKDNFDFEYLVLEKNDSFDFRNKLFEFGFKTVRRLKKISPDIVIAGGFSLQTFLVSRFCRKKDIPFLVYSGETEYTAETLKMYFFRKLLRYRINKNTRGYIVYGKKAKEYVINNFSAVEGKVYEVINTVDTEEFRKNLAAYPPINDAKFKILYVGDLLKHKGVDLLLKSFVLIEKDILANVRLSIIGDGEKFNELKRIISENKLTNVELLGKISHSEIAEYYKNCDLFILPSLNEHFGLVLVEAAIAGKPLIASKFCGGAYDLIEEGVNGYIIDPYNSAEFADRIKELASSKEKSMEFGSHSLEIIKNKVNINIATGNFCKSIIENIS